MLSLSGTEETTVEITGVIPANGIRIGSLPSRLQLAVSNDEAGVEVVEVGVAFIKMRGLRTVSFPGPRFDYTETLYRLGVMVDGEERGWLALRCDLEGLLVRRLASALIRYPVHAARITIAERKLSPDRSEIVCESVELDPQNNNNLVIRVHMDDEQVEAEVVRPRRVFVVHDDRVLEIPWDERPAPERVRARVDVEIDAACRDVFGAAPTFDPHATIHRGRTHLCGPAKRLPATKTG